MPNNNFQIPALEFKNLGYLPQASWISPEPIFSIFPSYSRFHILPKESEDPIHHVPSMMENIGLLEAVLYESQTLKTSNSKNSNSNSNDAACSSDDDWDWEAYGDPMSPLGHSAVSVFTEYTHSMNIMINPSRQFQ
ncbi:unnamed protein product [Lactuca virosa]|uniref:Uncharacterized protein n=1 Tax=Lactuca virosa TaxID=75947 RepID=A0AAU9NEY4_9ASTR|nr:unnamed protein product [Lactuca virosa]